MTSVPAVISRRDFARLNIDAREHEPAAAADYWLRVHRRAMACRFEVTLAGEDAMWVPAARAALNRVDAIESRLTVFRESSDVVRLNRTAAAAPVRVDKDLFALVQLCHQLHADTEGAFDITSTPLSRAWGFLRREGRLPGSEEIASMMQCVGMHHVALEPDDCTISFAREHVELNLGAIGKGWALDRIAETLRADGVTRALLSAGRSSVKALGSEWPIDLTSPRVEQPLAHVWLRSGAIGTSGAGEQFFMVGGLRYGHVLDPRTGWPATGALSVSVVAEDAAQADALSTAFFVGGIDLARRYTERHPSVLVVFTPDDHDRRPIVIGEYAGAHVEVACPERSRRV